MAELLGGDGGAFIGFDAVSGGAMGGGGGNGEGEGMAHSAGVEFQVVMKQLGKRDTTTKLKVSILELESSEKGLYCARGIPDF